MDRITNVAVDNLHLKDLHLTQFRNYSELTLDFSTDINCFTGPNGSGKTNILDALHYLAFTRGFRSTQDQQAVQQGQQFFFNGTVLVRNGKEQKIACNFIKGKGKKLLVNQKPLTKLSEHIGQIPLVAILPNDTELINGPAQGRRRFLDMLISQYSPPFLSHLIQYERILSQRNALLRLFGEQQRFDKEELELWDEQLIPHGIAVQEGRLAFIAAYQPIFDRFFQEIVSAKEPARLKYRSSIEENTVDGWRKALMRQQQKDLVNHYSSVGIHRDDLLFYIHDRPLKSYGSQGQQKTFVIALKLAQYQLLHQQKEAAPLLLLDDIFDKLDEQRLSRIANILDQEIEGQIFITDTSQERLAEILGNNTDRKISYFQVLAGEVHKHS